MIGELLQVSGSIPLAQGLPIVMQGPDTEDPLQAVGD